MSEINLIDLTIDSEFEGMIPPLTEDEQKTLEDTILEDGRIYFPLIVWNNTIIDGHNRYRILQKHPYLLYEIREKDFADREEAKAWICKNQLGRRNLTPEQKKYLIGKQYESEKASHGAEHFQGNQYSKVVCSQNGNTPNNNRTCDRIAAENGISKNSVLRAENFAKAVDIAKTVSPDISQDILSGKLHPTDQDVNDIIKAAPELRAETIAQLVKPKERRKVKRRNKDLAMIDKIYEEMLAPKRVTEDSGLESLHSVTRNMMETCDVLFEHFPGMMAKLEYGEQVAEIMREAKNYIQKILDKIAKKSFSEKIQPMLQKSYEEMLAPKPKVDENSILRSLECAVEDFLRLHHRMEGLFPGLRSNSEYRARLIKPIEQIEAYLNELRAVEENAL